MVFIYHMSRFCFNKTQKYVCFIGYMVVSRLYFNKIKKIYVFYWLEGCERGVNNQCSDLNYA
jgi:hypothetical protein